MEGAERGDVRVGMEWGECCEREFPSCSTCMQWRERERKKGKIAMVHAKKKEEIPFARNAISLLHHHHVCRGRHFFVFQRKRKDKCAKWKHFFAKEEREGERKQGG